MGSTSQIFLQLLMDRVVVTLLLLPRPLNVVGGLAVVMFELPVRNFRTFSIMLVLNPIYTDIVSCPDKLTWGVSFDDGPSPYSESSKLFYRRFVGSNA